MTHSLNLLMLKAFLKGYIMLDSLKCFVMKKEDIFSTSTLTMFRGTFYTMKETDWWRSDLPQTIPWNHTLDIYGGCTLIM